MSRSQSDVFSMLHTNGETICIPVPKLYKDDNAFEVYQRKLPYIKEFCKAAGGGDEELGVIRVLSYLASRNEECYRECGKKAGLAMIDVMDTTAVAAMMTDCNLKQWQLLSVLKHVRHGTGVKICENPDRLKDFEATLVMPETGSYLYNYINKDDEDASELVEYEYQSMIEVFKFTIAQLLMENSIDLTKVRRVGVVNGADHGKGALRGAFRTLILLDDDEMLYKDVGNSTVFSSKDTSEVLQNTIQKRMKEDLKLLNESKLVLQKDEDGYIQCSLLPKNHPHGEGTSVDCIDVLNTGDIKWLAMLLGMEGHSGCWCIHCLLSPSEWKQANHAAGIAKTVALINQTVDTHNIDEHTASDPKYRGVSSRPVFDFLPVSSFVLPILHIRIGIFNDIDNWFLKAAHEFVVKSDEERNILKAIQDCNVVYEAARSRRQQFNCSDAGKERERLRRRTNRTQNEEVRFTELQDERDVIANERDSWRAKESEAKKLLKSYQSRQKRNNSSFYYAINEYWRCQGKHREAYHGGAWNGNDAKDVLRNPEKFYGGMRVVLLAFKEESIPTEAIDLLLHNIIELLKSWNTVFSMLCSKKRTQQMQTHLKNAIEKAVKHHRELGLSITPKVHLIEDHALDQFINMPYSLFYLIEEFVEQNHQKDHNFEEQVKRIKTVAVKAKAKAKKVWISLDSAVQKRIHQVHQRVRRGRRGPYKRKALTEPTPLPTYKRSIPISENGNPHLPTSEAEEDLIATARGDSMRRPDASVDATDYLDDGLMACRRLEGMFDRLG